MKRVVKATKATGYYYRYEVHWIAPTGKNCLHSAWNTLPEAEIAAEELLNSIFTDHHYNRDEKGFVIQNMYIEDVKTGHDVTTDKILDKGNVLLKQI